MRAPGIFRQLLLAIGSLSWRRLREAFDARVAEWLLATVLFMWGAVLLLPNNTFGSQAFAALRMMASEQTWAWAAIIGGSVRLFALAINGAWRPMHYVRAWMSVSTFWIWSLISLGFLTSGVVGTGLAVYPVFAVFEIVNLMRSARDAARTELAAKGRSDGGSISVRSPDPA